MSKKTNKKWTLEEKKGSRTIDSKKRRNRRAKKNTKNNGTVKVGHRS